MSRRRLAVMSPCTVPIGLLLALLAGFVYQTAEQKRDADDAAKLVEVLNLRPGSTVADIGAGGGALEPAISRAIGAEGRLYATDIIPIGSRTSVRSSRPRRSRT